MGEGSRLIKHGSLAGLDWSRQITFTWKSGETQHAVSIGTLEQWVNLFLLIIALIILILVSCAFRRNQLRKRRTDEKD